MTQLVFHIGDHKTGSSSIQRALLNGNWASDAVTLAYPDRLSAAQMAKTLYKGARLDEREQKWSEMVDFVHRAETDQADVAVMSAEHFSHVDPALMAETVQTYFPEHAAETRYISYLRPHPGSLLSHYAQQTKCGTAIRPLDRMSTVSFDTGFFLFAPRIEAWKAQFGDRLTVRPMIRSQLDGGDVVQDFLTTAAGGRSIRTDGVERTNESLTVQQLAAVREIQTVLRNKDIQPKMRVSVGQFLGNHLADKGPMGGDALKLSKSLTHDIATHLRDDANQVDAFLGGTPLFGPALDAAADTATDILQPHVLSAYAQDTVVTEIRKLSRKLAKHLKSPEGKTWKKWHHQTRGQAPRDVPENAGGKTVVSDTLDHLLKTIEVAVTPA